MGSSPTWVEEGEGTWILPHGADRPQPRGDVSDVPAPPRPLRSIPGAVGHFQPEPPHQIPPAVGPGEELFSPKAVLAAMGEAETVFRSLPRGHGQPDRAWTGHGSDTASGFNIPAIRQFR